MNGQTLARTLSAISVAMGAFALVAPGTVAQVFGVSPVTGNGYGEIGALYGGLFVAMGAIGLYGARSSVMYGPELLVAMGILWLGMAAGRATISLTAPETPGLISWLSCAFELGFGALLAGSGWSMGSKA